MTTTQLQKLLRMSRRLFREAYNCSPTRQNLALMANMTEQITMLGDIIESQESRQDASMQQFESWRQNELARIN